MIAILILLPFAGCALVKLVSKLNRGLREPLVMALCLCQLVLSGCMLYWVATGETYIMYISLCGMNVSFKADGFRSLYVCVAALMWFCTSLMSKQYFGHYHNRTRYYFFNLITLGGVTGMFLSDDLFAAFIFFEIMSMASYPWVAHEETPGAMRAAATYLGIAVLGGMVTLMGMMLVYHKCGSLTFDALRSIETDGTVYTAGALILFGFLAKAGAFPLHIWLPKAHPVAPAPASALLSGLLTKAGIFGVLVVSFGIFRSSYTYGCILLAIALITMLLGAVLGVFSTNLKRTLACSSMSQIGYILTGISASVLLGEEGSLALSGAFTHMVNHSALKLLLFMTAGAIYMNAHSLDLNKLRGYGRKKPLLHACYLLGALGLSGVPLFNGYISKTMIHEGLVEWVEESGSFVFRMCEWVFMFAAGLTTAYMLKTYICLFWEKNADEALQARYDAEGRKYLTALTRLALVISASLIPLFGMLPNLTLMNVARLCLPFAALEGPEAVAFFSLTNLEGGAITLIIGTLVYLFIVRKWMYSKTDGYLERWPQGLDLEDSVYRPVFCNILPNAMASLFALLNRFGDEAAKLFTKLITLIASAIENIGDYFAKGFTTFIALLSRILEGGTDYLALLIHEGLFVNHVGDKRGDVKGTALRVRNEASRLQAQVDALKPDIVPDPREVTDLRYGSYFTNTVTFGLIVATLGVVIALVYVIFRNR